MRMFSEKIKSEFPLKKKNKFLIKKIQIQIGFFFFKCKKT